jgi:hypothetical protein
VGLQVADDLQSVLERPQEAYASASTSASSGATYPPRPAWPGRGGVRLAQALVAAAVNDLQQLYGELDVADAAHHA